MPRSDAQKRADKKYFQNTVVQYAVRFTKSQDQDIIDHLNKQENKLGYIKRLIREDIAKEQGK